MVKLGAVEMLFFIHLMSLELSACCYGVLFSLQFTEIICRFNVRASFAFLVSFSSGVSAKVATAQTVTTQFQRGP